jgi:hypothetical protein
MGPFTIGVCHINYTIGNLMYVGRLFFKLEILCPVTLETLSAQVLIQRF